MAGLRNFGLLSLAAVLVRVGACREYPHSHGQQLAGGAGESLGVSSGAGGDIDQEDVKGRSGAAGEAAEAGAGGAPDVHSGGEGGAAGAATLPPLAPSEFPNLALWLEASVDSTMLGGEGGSPGIQRVANWLDASGNENNAYAPDPLHEAHLVEDGLNGHAVLHFSEEPSLLKINDSATLWFGLEPFTLLMVGRWSNSTEYVFSESGAALYGGAGGLITKTASFFPFDGIALFANYPGIFLGRPAHPRLGVQLEYGTSVVLSYSNRLNDDKYRLYVVRRPEKGVVEIRINGKPDGASQIPSELDVSAKDQPMLIGGWVDSPFRGDLAEIVAIAGGPKQPELERLEAYLLQKYALDESSAGD